jgi:hypothetical protein
MSTPTTCPVRLSLWRIDLLEASGVGLLDMF